MLAKTARQYIEPQTNYHDVLTPSQAVEMKRFLIALTEGAKLCNQAGVKPDIHAAMRSWGNVPLTAGEKAITDGFRVREKKAEIQRGNELL